MVETKMTDALDLLESCLCKQFPNCPLIPCATNKAPAYKHANVSIDEMWDRWHTWRKMFSANKDGFLIILRDDLIVVDIDDQDYVTQFEEKFPFVLDTVIQKTKKGKHYFFKRTPLCEEVRLFDGARQFQENNTVLPIDIKTKCSTGTGGCISVYPTNGKEWIVPLYNFTRETLPSIPDDFVKMLMSMKSKNKKNTSHTKNKKNNVANKTSLSNTFFDETSDEEVPDKLANQIVVYKMCPPHVDPKDVLFHIMKSRVDINQVRNFIDILSHKRAIYYSEWMEVMWVLQNILFRHKLYDTRPRIDPKVIEEANKYSNIAFENDKKGFVKKMFIIFDTFSQKCANKYNMNTCLKMWCDPHRDGLGIGTLCMWAKNDSPVDYYKIKMEGLEKMVKKCKTQHRYVSEAFHTYVTNQYICAGEKRWFYFEESLWKEKVDACRLLNMIHKGFRKDIEKFRIYEKKKMDELQQKLLEDKLNDDERTSYEKELDSAASVCKLADSVHTRIGDIIFVKNVVVYLSTFLIDRKFIEKLDSKPHLLAFTNGVWDLLQKKFRPSVPSDMLSKNVGYPYYEKQNKEVTKMVENYWETLHPITEQREYLKQMFARQLYGDNSNSIFHMHAGYKASASNGKSTFFDILNASLGDYAHKFPVEYITSLRGEPGKPLPEFEIWKGTRILYCSEPTREDKINSGVLKEYSGGEFLSYRKLNESQIHKFMPMFSMHLMCNNTPIIDGDDKGIQRRIRKIDYMSAFKDSVEVDPSCYIFKRDAKLVNELKNNPAFKMEFLRDLLQKFDFDNELIMPRCIQKTSQKLLYANDPVRGFVETYIVNAQDEYLPMKNIKDFYRNSEFYNPKKNIDVETVEEILKSDCIPTKTINRKTWRNVFRDFKLLEDEISFELTADDI